MPFNDKYSSNASSMVKSEIVAPISKSLLMLSVYPSEEAADASLEARQKSLSLFKGTLRDEFYSAGNVSVWGIVNPN